MNGCFRCRSQHARLNKQQLCAPCMTLWLSMTPADRRRLLTLVVSNP